MVTARVLLLALIGAHLSLARCQQQIAPASGSSAAGSDLDTTCLKQALPHVTNRCACVQLQPMQYCIPNTYGQCACQQCSGPRALPLLAC